MNCPHIPSCELYAQFRLESLLKVWKVNYCEGQFHNCARYTLGCSGEKVPKNLLPNGKLLEVPK
ncbi:MAG: hypothetical protein ACOZIN_21825 [Myxococcota bacterium]